MTEIHTPIRDKVLAEHAADREPCLAYQVALEAQEEEARVRRVVLDELRAQAEALHRASTTPAYPMPEGAYHEAAIDMDALLAAIARILEPKT